MSNGSSGVLLEGTLYLNRQVDGVFQGRVKVSGVAKLSITNKSDVKELPSKDLGKYGQISASVAIPKPSELKVEVNNFEKLPLAMALMGDDVVINSASGTVTSETVTAKLGGWVSLAHDALSPTGIVVKNSAGTTTYVAGVDYEVNTRQGWISALTGGAITDAQSIRVDYAYLAQSGFRIEGATRAQVKGELVLDGRNLVDGKQVTITIDSALLASDGEIDFMADDFQKLSMTGRMETIAGRASPYRLKYLD